MDANQVNKFTYVSSLNARVAAINARIEAMKITNANRLVNNYSEAYPGVNSLWLRLS